MNLYDPIAGLRAQALPLVVYAIQLALNSAWSPTFFGHHNMVRASPNKRADVVIGSITVI